MRKSTKRALRKRAEQIAHLRLELDRLYGAYEDAIEVNDTRSAGNLAGEISTVRFKLREVTRL